MELQERLTTAPLLSVTEAAASKIKQLMAEEPDVGVLRIAIQGGGCSGFQYGLGFDRGARGRRRRLRVRLLALARRPQR